MIELGLHYDMQLLNTKAKVIRLKLLVRVCVEELTFSFYQLDSESSLNILQLCKS